MFSTSLLRGMDISLLHTLADHMGSGVVLSGRACIATGDVVSWLRRRGVGLRAALLVDNAFLIVVRVMSECPEVAHTGTRVT